MSQGQLNRLQQQMNRLQQSMNQAGQGTNSLNRNFQRLNQNVGGLTTRLSQMVATGNLTRRELSRMQSDALLAARGLRQLQRDGLVTRTQFRQMSRDISVLRARLTLLSRDGNIFQRMSAGLLLLQDRMRRTNSNASGLRRNLGRMGDWGVGGIRGAVIGLGVMAAMFGRLTSVIKLTRRWTAILIATLVLLGPAAQAVGALLIAALGGAFIALGALALKSNTSVKKAFSDMKKSVAFDVREAAKPMEGALVTGMQQVSEAATRMRPILTEAFAATAPLVRNFVGAFTDMAGMSMTGIVQSLKDAGPAMAGFRTGMGKIGEGIGGMFDAMTKNGGAEALGRVWVVLGEEMDNLLTNIGAFINMAAKSETATMILVGVFRLLSGVLHLVEGALGAVDSIFGPLFEKIKSSSDLFGKTGDEISTSLGPAFLTAGADASTLRDNLDEVNEALRKNKKAREDIQNMDVPQSMKDRLLAQNTEEENRLLGLRGELTRSIAQLDAEAANSAYVHAAAVEALRQSFIKLNQDAVSRLDAQAAMERSIDEAVEKAKELKGKVEISPTGILNLDTKAGQDFQAVVSGIVTSTGEFVTKLNEANASQDVINAAWQRGREQLIGLADNAGVSTEAMTAFADIVLQTPQSVTTKLKVEKKEAEAAVAAAIAKIKSVPDEEKSRVTLEAHRAMERASQVESKLNALDGRNVVSTVTMRTINEIITNSKTYRSVHDIVGATGGLFTGSNFTKRGFAAGGMITGPGTGTSDDIFAPWLSNGEFVINARQTKKYLPLIDAINKDKLKNVGFASGGAVDARNDLKSQMSISALRRFSGVTTTSFQNSLAKPDGLSALVSTINQTITLIKKAFSGATESRLVSRMTSAGKALIGYEKKLTKVNTSLDKAKDKLDDLKQAASSLRESVSRGVLSATNITKVAGGDDKNVTMTDVMAQMRMSRSKSNQFAQALATLKQRGVSKDIIGQIAEAGIDGGGLQTAVALTNASSAEISELNEMQRVIQDNANAAGKTAADAMYGAGIKAAEGLVKGLTAQQKSIEAAMMNIAKSMEKAIKKALGIKSPSKVMMEVGHHTAEGFAVGMEKNSSVDTAWASMLNVKPSGGRGGTPATSGGGEIVIPVYIGTKLLDEIILDSNRRTVRTRGGNVQAVYGRKTS